MRDSLVAIGFAAALGLACGSSPQVGGGAFGFALDAVGDSDVGSDRSTQDGAIDTPADATPAEEVGSRGDTHLGDLPDAASPAADAAADATSTPQPIATCKQACNTAAACVPPNAPAWSDADNYACEQGLCRYLGCKDDKECATPGMALACAEIAAGIKACQTTCSAAKDCAQQGAPEYIDSDNYACLQGICKYTGCNGDAECKGLGNYVCRDSGAGVKTCVAACAEAKDCAVPNSPAAADADNYACQEGLCKYTGCNGDTECAGVGWPGTTWVCKP